MLLMIRNTPNEEYGEKKFIHINLSKMCSMNAGLRYKKRFSMMQNYAILYDAVQMGQPPLRPIHIPQRQREGVRERELQAIKT